MSFISTIVKSAYPQSITCCAYQGDFSEASPRISWLCHQIRNTKEADIKSASGMHALSYFTPEVYPYLRWEAADCQFLDVSTSTQPARVFQH